MFDHTMLSRRCAAFPITMAVLAVAVLAVAAHADDTVTHEFGAPGGTAADVDNVGGYDGSFYFYYEGFQHNSEGNLILWDGTDTYDGTVDDDFGGESAIVVFDPATGLGDVDEATGRQTAPFLPVTFGAGPFAVEQMTFSQDGTQCVIYQWRVTNTGGSTIPAKLVFACDWDLGFSSSTDFDTGYDASRRLAYQQDIVGSSDEHFTGGIALLSGILDNFRLGNCCNITDIESPEFPGFLDGTDAGDQDDPSDSDKEIALSVNLGMMAPGESRCVAFVQCVTNGGSYDAALADMQAEVDAAAALYATIPADIRCDPIQTAGATERSTSSEKGSNVFFSKVDIRWDDGGFVTQDTFLSLTNDYPQNVRFQMYFINGDPPLDADPATGERAHPGWNWADQGITLTADQPTYWSALTGQPSNGGLLPFTALDPGFPPGRPADDGNGRMLRGYIVGFAVDFASNPISWNHIAGHGTIVDYAGGSAWEYASWNGAVGAPLGSTLGSGAISLTGPSLLLMNFQAVGSDAFSGPRLVTSDTDLTLHPMSVDLRQDNDGPVTTKAQFLVWNMNEVKFSGTERCITCWDQTLLSAYGVPNHFALDHLQTDHGKARIDGVGSQVCDVDFDPSNNDEFPFPPGPGDTIDPRDVISQDAALLGVVARILTIDGGAEHAAAGTNLIGMGDDPTPLIRFDPMAPPPPAGLPADATPAEIDAFIEGVIEDATRPGPRSRRR